jgi:hypothetical protein
VQHTNRVEVRAVLENFDAVTVDGSAQRKPGKRRNQLLDRRVDEDGLERLLDDRQLPRPSARRELPD